MRKLIHTFGKESNGLTLVDLIIALFISSILLVGVFRAFISNVETTRGTLDVTQLDDKTRKVIDTIQSDINDVNGNIISGSPTIFPTVYWPNEATEEGSFTGFLLVKAEPRLPVLNLATDTVSVPSIYSNITVSAGTLGKLDLNALRPYRYLIAYNFENYFWYPLLMSTVTDNDDGTYTIRAYKSSQPTRSWTYYLTHPSSLCFSHKVAQIESDQESICIKPSGITDHWQKTNTVFFVADIIQYKLEDGNIVRKENYDLNNWHQWTQSIIATNVSEFKPSFTTNTTSVYQNADRIRINKIQDTKNFLRNLIPDNGIRKDDCIGLIGYQCWNAAVDYPNIFGFSYMAAHISGMHLKLKMATESGRARAVNFFTSIGNNYGNSSITSAVPTKVIATKEASDRDYGSMIANPSIYGDPSGGSASSPFFIGSAPMLSVVSKNEDTANDAYLTSICDACNAAGNCAGYPKICTKDINLNSRNDYLDCADPATSGSQRRFLGCINPSGALNDRNLNASNNKIDPKIVRLNQLASIQGSYTYDLSPSCSGSKCPLAGYYAANPMATDTVFPMTIQPYFNSLGVIEAFYLGVARLRIPDYGGSGLYYHPFYNSSIFVIDVTDEANPTSTLIRDYPALTIEHLRNDIASVSSLQIRNENISGEDYEYMYFSSHEAYRVLYRKRTAEDALNKNLSAWFTGEATLAFEDKDPKPTAFTWKYVYQDPDTGFWEERFVAFPEAQSETQTVWDSNRITSMLAADDGRIYYTTAQRVPDMVLNGNNGGSNQFFYNNEITYTNTIIDENGQPIWCTQYSQPAGCTVPSGTPKVIDWDYCQKYDKIDPLNPCYKNPDRSFSAQYPLGTEVRSSFDAKLKVAFKISDNDWVIKTIANLHDTATGIAQDPATGDLILSAPTNMKRISFEEMNYILAEGISPPNMDLGYKRNIDNFYTANNVVNALVDPQSPASEIEFRRLSGLNVHSNSNRLNIMFADMTNREVGYVVQQQNRNAKQLFGQIIYNDSSPQNNADRNLDLPVLHAKGTKDKHDGFASWVLPFYSTSAWVDPLRLDADGNPQYAAPGPIPLRPALNITDYSPSSATQGLHTRQLSQDTNTCYADPNDSGIMQGPNPVCGAHPLWRECAGDVLSQVSVGLIGRQLPGEGCGVSSPSPLAVNDPIILPVQPVSGGGSGLIPVMGDGGGGVD